MKLTCSLFVPTPFLCAAISSIALSSSALAASVEDAQSMLEGIEQVRASLTAVIEEVERNTIRESDELAMPLLRDAGASLGKASSFADQSLRAYKLALVVPDPAPELRRAELDFSRACLTIGVARSQIARGNVAADAPGQSPTDTTLLAAFGEELKVAVIALVDLRKAVNCP